MQDKALVERFMRYTTFDTQSDFTSKTTPSTAKQLELQKELVRELQDLGVTNAELLPTGIVMASIPATKGCEDCLPLGFLSHVDTATETSGKNVKARIVEKWDGKDIVLNAEKNIVLSPTQFPNMKPYVGQDLIVTDGTTLLGADDKAGVASIMSMVAYLHEHPETPHAKICIGFTPDEEIARSIKNFDVAAFGAKYAFTVDGGSCGTLSVRTFNAARAAVTFTGVTVHPGYCKGLMKSALLMCAEFIDRLPKNEMPQTTEGLEGYFHPLEMQGAVGSAKVDVLLRDFDRENLERRKVRLVELTQSFAPYADIEISDTYSNMKDLIDQHPFIEKMARQAYTDCGVKIIERNVRGGTDGSMLAAKGLPCPNIFAGGENCYGPVEYVSIQSMEKSKQVLIRLVELSAQVKAQ